MGDVSPRDYYSRQLKVPGWGPAGQQALSQKTVLFVGMGGLGCPAAQALVRAGVGRLVLVDPDRVEASNLPRQVLYNPSQLGRAKVDAAREQLHQDNPWVAITTRAESVTPRNVRELVSGADLVVEGTDNFATKFLVHDACLSAGVSLVAASLHQWEGQVTLFPFGTDQPGCWRCLYPEAPEDGCVGVCADTGVAGALASLVGTQMALAAVRHLLGHSWGPWPSSLWIDGTDGTTRRLRWKPTPDCRCHRKQRDWDWLAARESSREISWKDLLLSDDRIIVDLREIDEIGPADDQFWAKRGKSIVHWPWSLWKDRTWPWNPAGRYLLVCAHGRRSLLALKMVPPGIEVLSLKGGFQSLKVETEEFPVDHPGDLPGPPPPRQPT